MKHFFLVISLIVLFSCGTQGKKYPWFQESYDFARSVAGSRLIMLDFYADW